MPTRINYKTITQHLLFWAGFILFQAISYGWEDTDRLGFKLAPQEVLIMYPLTILLTYANLYVLIPRYYYRQKHITYAIAILLLLCIGGILARYLTHILMLPWEQLHNPARYQKEIKYFWIPVRIIRNGITFIPVMAVTMLINLMRRAYQQEKTLREIQQEHFSAEMGLLKAQINPHFFFNTLNSLYALTLKQSSKAPDMVLRLSNLMHYMLYEASGNKVLLQDEINHLENYMAIERMRFADRLDLSFQYSGNISGKMISPLLLLPFVENAFKHGISEGTGWITISLKVADDRLFFKVENSYITHADKPTHGLGLKNVKRRLELMYPSRYELQIHQNPDSFETDLKLDL